MDEKKTLFKQTKKAYKKAKRKALGLWKTLAIICLVLTIILVPANIALGIFDNTIVALAGGSSWELQNEDENAKYFESDFSSDEEMYKYGAVLPAYCSHLTKARSKTFSYDICCGSAYLLCWRTCSLTYVETG